LEEEGYSRNSWDSSTPYHLQPAEFPKQKEILRNSQVEKEAEEGIICPDVYETYLTNLHPGDRQ
jgi:hypothetical protein